MSLSTGELAALDVILKRTLENTYAEHISKDVNWATGMTEPVTAEKSEIEFPFVESVGLLVEAKRDDPPKYETLRGQKATIPLRYWHSAVRVSAHDLAQSDTPGLMKEASGIGLNAAFLNKDLLIEALQLGDTSAVVMYDGQNFFSNSHIKKPGVPYDNLLAGALSSTTFQAARTAMMRFPSDFGAARPMGIIATHLVVPPDLEYIARELMQNTLNPADNKNTENVLTGMAQVIAETRLTDVDDWYLIANGSVNKPFLHAKLKEFSPFKLFSELTNDSPAYRDHKERRWWGETSETVFPTHPFYTLKVLN